MDQGVPSTPDISPTAAPGVAFNYRYAFRMPAEAIASVQEQHASACEKLGPARCRITGMRYRLVNKTDVEGMLAFKLDPMIARQFGKAGVASVDQAGGLLIDSEISGEDAGSAIQTAGRREQQLRDELAATDKQLTAKGLTASERERLSEQAAQIRQSIRANADEKTDRQESLASTPMTFTYGSGDLIPGFDTRTPLKAAIQQAGNNFISGITILFIILVTLLPWALLLGLCWWIYRLVTRKRRLNAAAEDHREVGSSIDS